MRLFYPRGLDAIKLEPEVGQLSKHSTKSKKFFYFIYQLCNPIVLIDGNKSPPPVRQT
jgi:hypothetical protein